MAAGELALPARLTGRLAGRAPSEDATGSHAKTCTIEQLREGAQRIADRRDDLAGPGAR